ncbi:unnamed protein product [Citrullus colocynthis]|uniref:Uncharacterized protein n=1 Tax=Citrullus colocynthis TaxID=252529 RepID=A0ABP0XRK0_9ROSI
MSTNFQSLDVTGQMFEMESKLRKDSLLSTYIKVKVKMEGSKLPSQTKQHIQDILEGKKRSLRRKICSDEMLHGHQLVGVKVQREKSNVSSNDHDSLPILEDNDVERSHISAHPEHFTPNHNEKTVERNPISIPTLDSPSTRTRSALRRKETTSNGNRLESEDHIISEHPLETTTLPKRTRGPTKMKTIVVDKQSRVNLVFDEYGQPIGDESVGLASFLGPLV